MTPCLCFFDLNANYDVKNAICLPFLPCPIKTRLRHFKFCSITKNSAICRIELKSWAESHEFKYELDLRCYLREIKTMSVTTTIEDITRKVESLSRSEIKHCLKNFKGLKLDFTDEYLDRQSIKRLRHIFLAVLTTRIRRI